MDSNANTTRKLQSTTTAEVTLLANGQLPKQLPPLTVAIVLP
jgi:hypothetical protein